MRERLARVPTWAYLAAMVAVSTLIRWELGLRDDAAWIFPDEIVYSELAKSLAYDGEFAMRGLPGLNGVGAVYPTLIAPAFALFADITTAHDAVKLINSLLMSLTAIPVFLIARRLAGRGLALTAAGLSLAIPAMTYSGTVMTENAFYPVTATWALLLIRALERPTAARQAVVVLGIGFAYLTRPQAATFVPVLLTAILLIAWLDHGRRLWRGLWAFRWTGLYLVFGVVAVGVRQSLRGERFTDIMGAYTALREYEYPIAVVSHWLLYHLAELVIMLGVFPVIAFVIVCALGLRRSAPREQRVFAATAVPLVFWYALIVSAFASTPVAQRIVERYMFHTAPFFFVALAAWIALRAPRPWWAVWPAVLFTAALPAALPLNNFLNDLAVHDTVGLLPIWRWRDRLFSPETIDEIVIGAAILAALAMLLVPRRYAVLLPIALFVYFVAVSRPVEGRIEQAAHGAWEAGVREAPGWADDAFGSDAPAAVVWTGGGNHFSFWEAEFYNRSIGPIYALSRPYDAFGQQQGGIRANGVADLGGRTLSVPFAITDIWTKLDGKLVASNPSTAMAAYEPKTPLRVIEQLQGLYPDRWTGAFADYFRYDCERGASLAVDFETNPRLHPKPFVVTVSQHDVVTDRIRVPPLPEKKSMRIPLEARDEFCRVHLDIPASFAANETPGDLRYLGLRINDYRYEPR
jgi:hypothetical protein